MAARWGVTRYLGGLALAGAVAVVASTGPAPGQQQNPNEYTVKSEAEGGEQGEIWQLEITFKSPRIVKAYIPGRGTRLCWYLWYQVVNRTGEPRTFIPDFELVTLDSPGVYHDEVLPSVQEVVQRIEDPSNYQNALNSVTISAKPIPPTPEKDSYPRAVTGVAIWDASSVTAGLPESEQRQLAETTKFSIFVSGLSNGWVLVDPDPLGNDPTPIVRRKTLQLNFSRSGGRYAADSREFSFEGPPEWLYRSARLQVPKIPDAGPNP